MEHPPLTQALIAAFPGLSAELQKAARYVIDNPRDVALLSMREQARRAGVQPATMMRLAKQNGYEGYDEVRTLYADAMRALTGGFATKAGHHARLQQLEGEEALAANLFTAIHGQIQALTSPNVLRTITVAARAIAEARRVYCLGLRASHPVAFQMHYILSLIGEKSVLLDGIAGTGPDAIRYAEPQDVLFVASVLPYTRQTLDLATYAKERGMRIVALTDSAVSPLARLADHPLLAATESPGFYHTMTPIFALAEVLAVLIAGHGGEDTLRALKSLDDYHTDFQTHAAERTPVPAANGIKAR
ncbi:MurR/RpiR family transcriptional regulator [Roseibium aestuarii]|uniref:MurR/RpiR family transcriptional regulator n=1 Tax=Roseibium aestuarii TaxID=2600299 RepID=A0ABW4JVY5_9HYPH|nr:MurR/RpiR family transcriptional regulator [Roseibium aestuarii]